jgi:DNA polymerase-1
MIYVYTVDMSPLPKNNFFVIDLYNLIYRMFYAVPPMTLRDGTPIHAVYGVAKFLKSLWEDGQTHHLVIASDVGASFRVDISPTYK